MVYQDLSAQPTPLRQIPPLADRFLAFVFDIVFFAPLFSFILASLFRKLELRFFVSPDSTEFYVLFGVSVVFVSLLTILFQTLFLVWMGATPGKYFFKLQVVSVSPSRSKIRFSQALLRSFLWVLEVFFFMVPFLEVLSDPLRKPLHDRASGTMTVTLKKSGDRGPQAFESSFVRKILVVISVGAFAWIIFFTGHFYHLAVRGHFKKAELEETGYLCSSVTRFMGSGDHRMDKALALYLAGGISENCLASEADFVLWGQDESENSWAYLAKALLRKFDADQFQAYLEKSCESDSEGKACQIARHQQDPDQFQLPDRSLAALVLQATHDFESGSYQAAQEKFLDLSKKTGLEAFAQSGIVKTFWAQNKTERARGAYLGTVNQLGKSQQLELSAWVCHEEMDRHCSGDAIEACENLKDSVLQSQKSFKDAFVTMALVREMECRKTNALQLSQLEKLFKGEPDLLNFLKATSRQSSWEPSERLKKLRELAQRKEPVHPDFLRQFAVQEWAEKAGDESDLVGIAEILKSQTVQDLNWAKVYKRALESGLRMGSRKSIRELVHLPSEETVQAYEIQPLQIQAHYLAENYEKAWQDLQKSKTSVRSPASFGGYDIKLIERNLANRFASKRGTK